MNKSVDWSLLPEWILREYHVRYVKRALVNTLMRVPESVFLLKGLKLKQKG
jgi:hypothetical protein